MSPNVSVMMVRENLQSIPEYPPPSGYRVDRYRGGDEAAWLDIHLRADLHNRFSRKTFAVQFGTDPNPLEARQFFLIDPEHQGRGLSRPLLSTACREFVTLGHTAAYLTTSTARVAAIRAYSRFGFVPYPRDDAERAAWSVFEKLSPPA